MHMHSFSCAEVENIRRRWNSVMAYHEYHQICLSPVFLMFTDSLVATDIFGYAPGKPVRASILYTTVIQHVHCS